MRLFSVLCAVVLFSFSCFGQENPPIITLPPGELVPSLTTKDFGSSQYPWNYDLINLQLAHKKATGKGVKVGVIDTGIDANHPDLRGKVKQAKDFTRSSWGAFDRQGHGTHCAGVIGAKGSMIGVAPDCELYIAKVLNDSGSGSVVDIAAGIKWLVDECEVDVISASLGGPTADRWTQEAVRYANSKGVLFIAAAGNEGPRENTEGYPAGFAESISIAACDSNRNVANFSSRGRNVFSIDPGVGIRSTYPGGIYSDMSGTSMACPHKAGEAALWVESHPDVPKPQRPDAFRKAVIEASSYKERNNARGYGLVDCAKLVDAKPGEQPPPPPPGTFKGFKLTMGDLTLTKQQELMALGATDFELVIKGPPVEAVPTMTTKDGHAYVDYDQFYGMVKRGDYKREKVKIALGMKADGFLPVGQTDPPCKPNGLYNVWLGDDGEPKIENYNTPLHYATPTFGQQGQCPGGVCATPQRVRFR